MWISYLLLISFNWLCCSGFTWWRAATLFVDVVCYNLLSPLRTKGYVSLQDLFRALKTKHSTPKYGLIYHASSIGKASQKHNGKNLGLYLQKLLLLSDRMPLVLMRTTPLALRVDSRYVNCGNNFTFHKLYFVWYTWPCAMLLPNSLRHGFKFLKVCVWLILVYLLLHVVRMCFM